MSILLDVLPNPEAELGFDVRPLIRRANPWQGALRPTEHLAKQEMTALRESAFPVRTRMFDEEVETFLLLHPAGTVVQLGGGVSRRFLRLDNGSAHWIDVDCERCGAPSEAGQPFDGRVQHLCATGEIDAWIRKIGALPGPYCFVLGSRPGCFTCKDIDSVTQSLTEEFPGAWLILEDATVRASQAANEIRLVELLLRRGGGNPAARIKRRLQQVGAIVDRSRTLLDHLDLLLTSLPGRHRLMVPHFPGRYRLRFAEYQVLRVVLAS